MDRIIDLTLKNLKRHHFNALHFKNPGQCADYVRERIANIRSTAAGGSKTLDETGIRRIIENESVHFIARDGASEESKLKTEREALNADMYFAGINALSRTGVIVNIDKRGNRVGAVTFGPKEVILVSGTNKICQSVASAVDRAKNIAAVNNCRRFGLDTPCIEAGECIDCEHEDNICYTTVIMRMCYPHDRITVCLIDGEYGF